MAGFTNQLCCNSAVDDTWHFSHVMAGLAANPEKAMFKSFALQILVKFFRNDDVFVQHVNLTDSGRLDVKAILWLKQVLEIFVCGLGAHNSFVLKSA